MATRDVAFFELITAANMAGVDQAKAGFFGMNKSTLALAASLGALIFIGKAAIDNTEAMDKANRSLSQAADVSKLKFDSLKSAFDAWAESNKRYIPDQYAAETALAAFVRAGANAKDAMRELNDALDLSTLRGMSMGDAQKQVTLALTGSSKALKVLGITTDEYNHIMHNKTLTTEQKHLALLHLIETKTKDGHKAQTDLTQSTQAMNKDWQDITTKVGPPLIGLFSTLVGWVDKAVKALDDLGNNKDWNKFLTQAFGNLQEQVKADVLWVERLLGLLGIKVGPQQTQTGQGQIGQTGSFKPRASGGPVMVGQAYTVGERGPETLVMGSQGGSIIPNGGGRGGVRDVHIHIDSGAYIDGPGIDILTAKIADRLRFATGI